MNKIGILLLFGFLLSNTLFSQINLSKEPYMLPTPEFKGTSAKGTVKKAKSVQLNKLSQKANKIIDEDNWFTENKLDMHEYLVPNHYIQRGGNCPEFIPPKYKNFILTRALYDDKYYYIFYGINYVDVKYLAIIDKSSKELKHFLDFENYTQTPANKPENNDFIYQSVVYSKIEGDILYVCNKHNTYAESSKGLNGYITAINLKDYSVIWRSKPLVCNSNNFILYNDVIICGYGFTAEKDNIFVLDKYTGKIMKKIPVKSSPDYFVLKNDVLYVRTYNTDYTFKLK